MSKRVLSLSKVFLTIVFVISMLACALTVNFASADEPLMVDGGSIRYQSQGNAGIRFSAYVPDSLFDDVETKDLKDNVSVGMYLIPATSVSEGTTAIDGQTEGVKTISPTVWTESDKEGYQQYNVVIKGIPETDYATEILASSFIKVDGVEEVSSTVIRSIANVANTLLAMDALVEEGDDMKLDTDQITELGGYATATEALGDVEVTILDGVAKWSAVENATAYIVKTENGLTKTTETEYALDGASEISVIAYGDGVNATYSAVDTVVAHTLGEMELATFNDESYIQELVAGSDTINNYDYSATKEVHTATYSRKFYKGNGSDQTETPPTFEDGIASFGLGVTNYAGHTTLNTSVFTIYLQKSLNLNDHAGIIIKLMFDSFTSDPSAGIGGLTFKLAHPTTTSGATGTRRQYGYVIPNDSNPYIGGAEISATAGEWIEWTITSEQLSNFYSTGDNKLVISFFTDNAFATNQIRTAYFKIDDISYFDGISVPQNVVLEEKVLSWDAVEGADKYVIDVNGDTYETTEISYDLSSILTADATIKVQTVIGEESSDYSEAVYYYAPTTGFAMVFDSESYVNRVKVGTESVDMQEESIPIGFVDYKEYLSSTTGSDDGALYIKPIVARYASWSTSSRLALFTIVLSEELSGLTDGTNDGVSISIKLGNIVAGHDTEYTGSQPEKYYLCLVANGEAPVDGNYRVKTSANLLETNNIPYIEINNDDTAFTTWNITIDQLASMNYVDGSTEITFVILTETAVTSSNGFCIEAYIDALDYYKEET